jgi:group I intron endonuclease
MGIVYVATHITNGKAYIGQTTLPLQTRWRLHISAAKNGSKSYFHSALRKYGPESFSLQELAHGGSQEELNALETHYIQQYETRLRGYNLAAGGQSINHKKMADAKRGRKLSETHRRKLSEAHKNLVFSEAHRQHLREACVNNPNLAFRWMTQGAEEKRVPLGAIQSYLGCGWRFGRPSAAQQAEKARQAMIWTPEKRTAQAETARKQSQTRLRVNGRFA